MTQGPVSARTADEGQTSLAIGAPVGRRHSAPSQAGYNFNFSIVLRIWDRLLSDVTVSPEFELQAVSVTALMDAWICASDEERGAQNHHKLNLEDKKAMSALMNFVVQEIGVDCCGRMDACEWLYHSLVRFSKSSLGWSIALLSGLMRLAAESSPGPKAFYKMRSVLQKAEDENGGPLRFSDVIMMYCKFVWKEVSDESFIRNRKLQDVSSTRRHYQRLETALQGSAEDFADEVISNVNIEPDRRISVSAFMVCCLGRPRREVLLHQYDLTRGGAKVMSLMHLEGVWHTGLVIYGREYFFNGELVFKDAGLTSFGTPTKVAHLGYTYRRKEELHFWVVEELKPIFTRQSYDILDNNCNHFTDRIAVWLCGNHLPEEVTRQADMIRRNRVLSQMLRPVFRAAEACCLGSNSTSEASPQQRPEEDPALGSFAERRARFEAAAVLSMEEKLNTKSFEFSKLFRPGNPCRKRPEIIRVSL